MIGMDFITAGKAVFTVSNNNGEHYTYKIRKHKTEDMFFASVLTGNGYVYMGVFDKHTHKVYQGKKGMNPTAKCVRVIEWAMTVISGTVSLPEGYNIQHMNVCGCCSRPLTDPISIETGLGPVCRSR